ncbi:hypothetical protein CHS0354_000487 [Potamilus streckersoni]|uniref:S1 motif domain-containing protein n=1 Tax=Potamilus streckersoni TaxID=2493646 RepID=A0AAE0T7R2_9BIVA|nr:hypothetical protein CHS0354_000487 [Potamilus streckersoni]
MEKNVRYESERNEEGKGVPAKFVSKFYADYPEDELKEYEVLYSNTLETKNEGEIVSGRVVKITDKDVIIDIGLKSEGSVSISDFLENEVPKVGDTVDVFLELTEDKQGQVVLSKRKADAMKVWEMLYDSLTTQRLVQGKITSRVKGGMKVNVGGIEAFLPGSQIDVRPIRDFDALVGQRMDFRVLKINSLTQNVIVSHKVLVEEEYKKRRDDILAGVQVGMVLEGVVKNITDFGVFVDLGGLDGLVHITDIAWGRVNHPSEVVKIDDVIQVAVIGYDQEKQRVSLGMKQLSSHPWQDIETKYPIGTIAKAKVLSVADYGVFLELEKGIEGLVHISEVTWIQQVRHAVSAIRPGDFVDCVVLNIDKDAMKLSLSIRQATSDPWKGMEERHPVGSVRKGVVRNLTEFGAFVELEEGIDGLVHISDLSWTRKTRHPGEILKPDMEVEVKVLKVDVENRKISLGVKQMQSDPWVNFDSIFGVGVETKGVISQILEKGVIVTLDHGVDGFVPKTHLLQGGVKNINVSFKRGDQLPLKVIEFDKENRRVILSALAYFKDKSKEEIEEYMKAHPREKQLLREEIKDAQDVYAQYYQTSGGRLIHVQEALNPRGGTTNLSITGDVYVKPNGYEAGYDGINSQQGQVPHISARVFVNFDWSVIDYLTFGVGATLYNTIYHYQQNALVQKDEARISNFLENLLFTVKVASIPYANNYAYFGVMGTVSIPISPQGSYNSYGNPYSAGGFEVGVYVLNTVYFDNFFPRESFSASVNLGFYQYFDQGRDLSNYSVNSLISTNSNSSSFNYSVGLSLPASILRFYAEFWGWMFIAQPPIYAYTRENIAIITAGMQFRLVEFFSMDISFDYQVAGTSDDTRYSDVDQISAERSKIFRRPQLEPSNYTPWRVNFGLNLIISGSYSLTQFLSRQPPPVDFTSESRDAKVVLKRIEDVSLDKLTVSERINELRKRRQDIERNLQILKQILREDVSAAKPASELQNVQGDGGVVQQPTDSASNVQSTPGQEATVPVVETQALPSDPVITNEDVSGTKKTTVTTTTRTVRKVKEQGSGEQQTTGIVPEVEAQPVRTQDQNTGVLVQPQGAIGNVPTTGVTESDPTKVVPSEGEDASTETRKRRKRRTRRDGSGEEPQSTERDAQDSNEEEITK